MDCSEDCITQFRLLAPALPKQTLPSWVQSGQQARQKLRQLKTARQELPRALLSAPAQGERTHTTWPGCGTPCRSGSRHKRHASTCHGWDRASMVATPETFVSALRCWARRLIGHRLSKRCKHVWSNDCKTDPVPQTGKVEVKDLNYQGAFKVFRSIRTYCFLLA